MLALVYQIPIKFFIKPYAKTVLSEAYLIGCESCEVIIHVMSKEANQLDIITHYIFLLQSAKITSFSTYPSATYRKLIL